MGHTTDFVGHFEIAPTLNAAETEYLAAFARSRRWARPGGPYAVPGNPYAPDDERDPTNPDAYNRPAPGQPQLWCQWVPFAGGSCLAWDGQEKFYEPVAWLAYLIDHFLGPGALASEAADEQFAQFTFDHVVSGTVAACRRDTRELALIEVIENQVRKRVLRPGDPQPWELPMPYETAADRWRRPRPRPNRNLAAPPAAATVVPLTGRRCD